MAVLALLRRLNRIGSRGLLQTTEAAIALTLAFVAIKVLPFRILIKTLGRERQTDPPRQGRSSKAAGEIRRAIQRAVRHMPRSIVCFPQALAAHWMLRRRGYMSRVHYGLRNGTVGLTGHVWISLGETVILGEEFQDPHACVAVFPQPRA